VTSRPETLWEIVTCDTRFGSDKSWTTQKMRRRKLRRSPQAAQQRARSTRKCQNAVMSKELQTAGISDPQLRRDYLQCRKLNATHGKTYYLATLLLPPAKRPFVHALYGFARYADDIVDNIDERDLAARTVALDDLRAELASARQGHAATKPVISALLDTADRWQIPDDLFSVFLDAMQQDLSVTSYASYADLQNYMAGSAVAIGLQMLPILEPSDFEAATTGATALAEAFQLANFIRDVGDDLDRGRIYLPLADLAEFDVTPTTLQTRLVDDNLRCALSAQIERVRQLSTAALPTIALLHPSVQDCIHTARVLYCEIADQVEKNDYQVFAGRARVPRRRRAQVAGRGWVRAQRARRKFGQGTTSSSHPAATSVDR